MKFFFDVELFHHGLHLFKLRFVFASLIFMLLLVNNATKALGTPVYSSLKNYQDCIFCPEMVMVPEGKFYMGSPSFESQRYDDEGPVHQVKISSFLIGKTPVTKGQFTKFVEASGYVTSDECWIYTGKWDKKRGYNWRNPGYLQQDSHPVTCVNWNDAIAYVNWLSRVTGSKYRLPSEAEWEYAARAGTTTARFWGNDPSQACGYANVGDQELKNKVKEVTWEIHNCNDGYAYTSPVGSFKPNKFGLYDMQGNVWQWVGDNYHNSYVGAPRNGKEWLGGGTKRVLRGASWGYEPESTRIARRSGVEPDFRNNWNGFRVARSIP